MKHSNGPFFYKIMFYIEPESVTLGLCAELFSALKNLVKASAPGLIGSIENHYRQYHV